MPSLSAALPIMFAQAPNAPAGGGAAGGPGSYTFLIYIGVIGLWFYLLLIRPQQKQEKQRKSMLSALKKNDRVITSAGIYGTVVTIDDAQERVVLRIDDDRGVKVAFTRGSIVRVLDGQEKEKEKEKATETA
jgi:preprotein translocase subunit YajC